mgnify:CR=1 FL=1
MRIKRLIHRLVAWLRLRGLSADDIAECISYITK